MVKMTYELAKTFRYKRIEVIEASTGKVYETYNGDKDSALFMLGNDWFNHEIRGIEPRCAIVDGDIVVSLGIWVDM